MGRIANYPRVSGLPPRNRLTCSRIWFAEIRAAISFPNRAKTSHSTVKRIGVTMSYQIKYLGLGGILDQAIAIIKDRFGLLFSIMLWLFVPFTLITGFVVLALTPSLPADSTLEQQARAREMMAHYWPYFGIVSFASLLFIYPVTNAAVIQAVARVYLGQRVTALEALKHGLNRLGPLIWTTILMYLAIWGGLILFIIPGIYFAIWFGLSQHVVVIEGLSGRAALGRSKKLVHANRGKFLALMIILTVIAVIVNQAARYIPQPHVRLIGATLLQAVTMMLSTAALVVFYFSCRCAVDNFDLHYLAESIGVDAESADESLLGGTGST